MDDREDSNKNTDFDFSIWGYANCCLKKKEKLIITKTNYYFRNFLHALRKNRF